MDKSNSEIKRFFGWIGVLASALLCLWMLLIWLSNHSYFHVKSVDITPSEGSFRYLDKQEMFSRIVPYLSGSSFWIDMVRAKHEIQGMPWVREVEMRRDFPSAVQITVSEYKPVARWVRDDFQAGLVGEDGSVFQANYQGQLLELDGDIRELSNMLEQYRAFSSQLKPLRLKILRLQYTPRASWGMILDNGVELKLGTENVSGRLARFVEYWPRELAVNAENIEYVDMRYPKAFAVRFDSGTHRERQAENVQLDGIIYE